MLNPGRVVTFGKADDESQLLVDKATAGRNEKGRWDQKALPSFIDEARILPQGPGLDSE